MLKLLHLHNFNTIFADEMLDFLEYLANKWRNLWLDKTKADKTLTCFTTARMVEIASTNGFVVTEASVYDSLTGKRVEIDTKLARIHLKKFRNREYAKEFEDRVVISKAIKTALKSHNRFMLEILPRYTPDLMF